MKLVHYPLVAAMVTQRSALVQVSRQAKHGLLLARSSQRETMTACCPIEGAGGGADVTNQAMRRLIALLRIIERPGDDALTDDALLDSWFGTTSDTFAPDEW